MFESGDGHTVKRLDGDLMHLTALLMGTGNEVLAELRKALAAIRELDPQVSQELADLDQDIHRRQLRAEAEICEVLAKWCPHAGDLRLIMAVHRGVTDLERIGDEALRIADLVEPVVGRHGFEPDRFMGSDVKQMGELAVASLEGALAAFEHWDEEAALAVIGTERTMNEQFHAALRTLMDSVADDSRHVAAVMTVILLIQSLDRIGHYARKLAEDVILRIRGGDALAR